MKTSISQSGDIILPDELRRQDAIEAGQEFEILRIAPGNYRLTRTPPTKKGPLVDLLLACPVKDWFEPLERNETVHDIPALRLE